MPKSTLTKVKAKQSRRTRRARAADAAGTAKTTFSTRNRDGLGRWMKSPRRTDVSGIDTKGAGRAGITLRQHLSDVRAELKARGMSKSDMKYVLDKERRAYARRR